MAAFPVGKDHGVGLELANYFGDGHFVVVTYFEMGVGEGEISANPHSENFAGRYGFAKPLLGSAASAGLAAREVEDAGSIAGLRHFDERAATGEFGIVGVWGNHEQIEFHEPSVGGVDSSRAAVDVGQDLHPAVPQSRPLGARYRTRESSPLRMERSLARLAAWRATYLSIPRTAAEARA